MSRVGNKPIPVPEKTKITYSQGVLTAEGPKGTLTRRIHPDMNIDISEDQVAVTVDKKDKKTRALWGTTRAQVANIITGVSRGFERVLEISGIGYRAELKGNTLELHLGYSHPINFELPEGVDAQVEKGTIRLSCIDKERLGFAASSIRKMRPPEPYKGKGVKYAEEQIQRKAGKTAK
ncbi:MAG: 50S ribosomal protein L6 [Desulfobacterales bacterium]